jgi:RNA polymerase sigma factor (sigma-70 family)
MESQRGAFPPTRISVVRALGSDDRSTRHRAHEALATMYWKPVYKYIRIRWGLSRDDVEDLTQDFFSDAFEKEWFRDFDVTRARFRTFLRVCVDRSIMKAQRSAGRRKRGGDSTVVSMDVAGAEAELALASRHHGHDPDELFRREWVRSVFESAISRLRTELVTQQKATHFELFSRYDLHSLGLDERPTYGRLASELAIPVTQVTNYLAVARRRFREIVLELLADTTGDDRDYADSVRELLGMTS